jgi:DNA-binding transcriptional regulator YdaS (Cro superfamily)
MKSNFLRAQTIETANSVRGKLQPVDDVDWAYLRTMPTYNQSKEVVQSDWWKAATFLEMYVH